MKTKAELKFDDIIKTCFHERLKPLKFKKRGNNFYRDLGEVGHIINIQKSMFGSKENISFTANIGIFSPIFWDSIYNFKNEPNPPSYPTEPVSIIRKRIGRFIDVKDKWYDLDKRTETEPLKYEISGTLEAKVLPFFEKIRTNNDLIRYLEQEYDKYDSNYLRFVLYGELGMTNKLENIYRILINECNEYQIESINEKAVKYGIEKIQKLRTQK